MGSIMKIRINRKSVLFRIAVAYLLLIMLPFGAGIVFLTINYENQIQTRWVRESEQRLEAMQTDINTIHLDLNSILVKIQQDVAFSPVRIRRNSYHTMLAMNQLKRFSTANEILHILAYVHQEQDFVLSNISSDNMEHFAQRFFGFDDEERNDFWNLISSNEQNSVAEPIAVIPNDHTAGNTLVYSASLRGSRVIDSPQILILIDSFSIKSHFENLLPNETAGLFITNSEGKAMLFAGNLSQSLTTSSSLSLLEAEQYSAQYGLTLAYSVGANGWHYFMFLSTADILQEVRGATWMFILFGIAFMLASIMFFAISYRYNFLPLRKFVRFVRQNTADQKENLPTPYMNEYELITESYQALLDKAEAMQQISRNNFVEGESLPHRDNSSKIVQNVHNAFKREVQELMKRFEDSLPDMDDSDAVYDLKDRAMKYIADNYREPGLSIDEIAEKLEVSAGHLSRTFKKETGETPLSHINTKRVEHAKHLLANTNLPLHDIIREIGFMDVSSFHRKFKVTVGVTPGTYRREHKIRK